jgi:hypothetical protein
VDPIDGLDGCGISPPPPGFDPGPQTSWVQTSASTKENID